MPVRVVDRLEVIQIDKQNAEFVTKSRRAVNLGVQCFIQMPRVIQTGAVVCDRQFLNLLYPTRVFNGNRRVVAQRLQKEQFRIFEPLHVHIDELDHAQHAQLRSQWHANHRPRLPLGGLIHAIRKNRVRLRIRHHPRFPVLCHPPGNTLAHFQPHTFQRLSFVAHRDRKVEFVAPFVHHQQRPRIRTKILGHLIHDGLQNRVEIQRRRERLGHVVKDRQFLILARQLSAGLGHAEIPLSLATPGWCSKSICVTFRHPQ